MKPTPFHLTVWSALGAWLVLWSQTPQLSAQNYLDAIRYSDRASAGTARALGMGGAFGAVGADFTSAVLNPAGLALTRRSEMHFSTYLQFIGTDADYLGQTQRDNTSNFGLPGAGLIIAAPVAGASETGLQSWAFSIGYTQVANFRRNTLGDALNDYNSITNWYQHLAESNNLSDADLAQIYGSSFNTSYAATAWANYLLNSFEELDPVAFPGVNREFVGGFYYGGIQQRYFRQETGRNNQWNVNFAGNFANRVFFGAGLGISGIRYRSQLEFTERDIFDRYNTNTFGYALNNNRLSELVETRGSGFEGRFGVIVQPTDFFRFGVHAKTPQILFLTDDFSFNMQNTDDAGNRFDSNSDPATYDYSLTTPYLVGASMAFILGTGNDAPFNAMIALDYEFMDHSTASFNVVDGGNPGTFTRSNREIQENTTGTHHARAGVEIRYDQLYFRAGGGIATSPLTPEARQYLDMQLNIQEFDTFTRHWSLGFGYRSQGFYLDLAWVAEARRDLFAVYGVPERFRNPGPGQPYQGVSPVMTRTRNMTNVVLTMGFRFKSKADR